jgi:pimeloyl-ACP methyl ester carboxylesterase
VLLVAAPASGRSVVVELHWGGFTRGSAADVENEVDALRARGVEVVNYDYRLGIPLRVERDVARFVRGLRAGYDEVYLYGQSAGGTVALSLAQRGLATGAVAVSPVVSIPSLARYPLVQEGSLGTRRQQVRASPLHQPCDRHGPLVVVHGTADPIASFPLARRYAERCHATLEPVEGADHGITLTPQAQAVDWLARHAGA